MSEFTKEELQIIHLDMTAYINRTTMLAESPSHKALRDKVERMIDGYCEHGNTGSTSEVDYVYHCNDCGQITGVQ